MYPVYKTERMLGCETLFVSRVENLDSLWTVCGKLSNLL